jgi:Permuted papain-like amidase enzyme, YaeF/YiiX, C92 family
VNLKPIFLAAVWACSVISLASAVEGISVVKWQEGDILFNHSERGQSEAIIAATGSPITHCGIIFLKNGKLMVLEAVQPVRMVPLEEFVSRSAGSTVMARRLKTPPPTERLREALTWAEAQMGKDYDVRFLWSDEQLYCSELVWKIYQHAGVELCELRHFRDYDLGKPAVRKIINERFGSMAKVPLDEKVVAPSDLAASPLLMDVPLAL